MTDAHEANLHRATGARWEVQLIDASLIQPGASTVRRCLEHRVDENFVDDVTQDLVHPLIARSIGPGRYEVIAGARRWFAFKKRNLPVPCIVLDLGDRESLWMAYSENVDRLDLDAAEEAELILRLLDASLEGAKEYEAVGKDAKKALAVVYNARKGRGRPPKRIDNDVVVSLSRRIDQFFLSLPRSRNITGDSFYVHKLPLLRLPANVLDELNRKVVHSTATAQELIASIKDELARAITVDWVSQHNRVPLRVLEKRVRALNRVASLLKEMDDQVAKESVVHLVLEKGLSPRSSELELRRLLPRPVQSTASFDGVQVYCPSDSADMGQIDDSSVRLIVTSPPYGGKVPFEEDYLSKAKTPDEYFSLAEPIIEECFRVLAPAGKFVLNWADPIGEWGSRGCLSRDAYEEHIYIHRWVELAHRVGFRLWGRRIWNKNVYYSLAQNRVRVDEAFHGEGRTHLDWEWLLTFRKPGPAPVSVSTTLGYEEWVEYSRGVWHIPGAEEIRVFAVFPQELVARFIKMYSCEGDLVLDPFLGTGTTVAVAKALGRRAAGYEINPDLKPLIEARMHGRNLSAIAGGISANSQGDPSQFWITGCLCDPNPRSSP